MVTVADPVKTFSEDANTIEVLSPKVKAILRQGDVLDVSFQGAPGGVATFHFTNKLDSIPMQEQLGSVLGFIKGFFEFNLAII